jgi:hypothetical protein
MKSEFADWFVAQHKPRTNSGMPNHTDQQLRDMVHAGRVAERVLACRELWDDKQTSALYAWQAREKTPNAEVRGASRPAGGASLSTAGLCGSERE